MIRIIKVQVAVSLRLNQMVIFKKALCAISLIAAAQGALALEIDVDNRTDSEVVLAFSYLDKDSKAWMVEGW